MAVFETKFSKEIDRNWIKLEFTNDGLLSVNSGSIRIILGDVPQPIQEDPENVGNQLDSTEGGHEFEAGQILWVRAIEGVAVVTQEEEVSSTVTATTTTKTKV